MYIALQAASPASGPLGIRQQWFVIRPGWVKVGKYDIEADDSMSQPREPDINKLETYSKVTWG
jgi:hypothetical protein